MVNGQWSIMVSLPIAILSIMEKKFVLQLTKQQFYER